MDKEKKAEGNNLNPAVESLAYGETVYWMTLAASIVVMFGAVLAFITKANYVSPSYWISSVWLGSSTEEIWIGAVGSLPHGHWYLAHLATGDGLQAFGMCLAVFSIVLGMIGAAIIMFRRKSVVSGAFALIAAGVLVVSLLGLAV